MLRARNLYHTDVLLKWLLILAAAALAAMAVADRAAGTEPAPRLLPTAMGDWSRPIPPVAPRSAAEYESSNQAGQLRQILSDHEMGNLEEAIAGWQRLQLPSNVELWRHVALASAYLSRAELDAAAQSLDAARQIEPDHPMVHYYFGLCRLEQAARAGEWHDAIGPSMVRLVSVGDHPVSPNTRGAYELTAMTHLEKALDRVDALDVDEPLLSTDSELDAMTVPRVRDLLQAIRADGFEAKAHHTLGGLFLKRGLLECAEEHFDAASALGVEVLAGYRRLGNAYEQRDRHFDAVRAYGKAVGKGGGYALPTVKMLSNLRKGFVKGEWLE